MAELFFSIFAIITIATLGAFLARLFKQPLIPAYILTGVVLGPAVLGLATNMEVIRFFSEVGIAFLLFVVGLELNFKKLKTIGLAATIGGSLQIFLVFLAGFIVSVILGFYYLEAVYIALIIAFSSTLVVVKLLSDEKEIDTLHGKIIIGILLVQDVAAILALPLLSSLNNLSPAYFLIALGKGALIFVIAIILSRLLFPELFKFAAKTRELLFLVSLTVLFLFAMLAINLGLTVAVGGLIAGLTLANLPYNYEIVSKVRPLRDFFATLFFVSLGMNLTFGGSSNLLLPLVITLVLVIVFKPLILMVLINFFGYANRTSFLASVSLAQVSEFSLIIAAQGLLLGQISQNIFVIAVLLSIITISMSAYFIHYDSKLYSKLERPLKFLNYLHRDKTRIGFESPANKYNAVIIGCDRIGHTILNNLLKLKKSVFVVDFNPDIVKDLVEQKIPCLYGDINDADILDRINMEKTDLFISTIPDIESNIYLLKEIKVLNKNAITFVTATNVDDALKLYEYGADYVILPHFLGGDQASLLLEQSMKNFKQLLKTKSSHIQQLHNKKKLGHEHPSR